MEILLQLGLLVIGFVMLIKGADWFVDAASAVANRLGIPALILAGLIAFSRLYLYVHYVTDVLVSVGLGIGFAFLAAFLVKKGYSLYQAKKAVQ